MRIFLLFLLSFGAATDATAQLAGTVLDSSGAPISNASVRLEAPGGGATEIRTGSDGRFEIPLAPSDIVRVIVIAPGFAQASVAAPEDGTPLQITLQPAPFFEAVNVTSSRSDVPKADPTVTMTVVPSSELLTMAAVTLDDALKLVPGFTLFRRTSSRVSNPTSQGVALRGIGGTAQSRSLVLVDGVPLNDAFGGWIYWNKVPQVLIDRIEVQRGSGSDLYGADAVGGVVQLLTLRPARPTGRALFEGGELGQARASVVGGARTNAWRYSAGGEWFTIDGYIPIATEQNPGIAPRGPIDGKLGSTHRSAIASVGFAANNGWRADVTGNVYDEDRKNATPASINSTASNQISGDLAGGVKGGLLSVRLFGGTQRYRQTFSTVNATRTAETLTRDQHIPSTAGGLGAQWFREWGRHTLLLGAEGRYVDGASIETPYSQGQPLANIEAGGIQHLGSGFVQDTIRWNDRLTLVLGAHGDSWRSTSDVTGNDQSSGSFNPRVSASYRIGESGMTVRGAAYHGFRAPTLNELYRTFSAGNVLTRPNEALSPERLTGGDAGVTIARGRTSARVTGFWNVLDEAITTITISTTPQQIIRQRANADTLHAAGLEVEADVRLLPALSASLTSGFVSSRFKGGTDLRNKKVPQVPPYNVGLNVRYDPRPWTSSLQVRVTGAQYEDDLNAFELGRATVLDVFAGRTLAGRITAFVAVENLLDATYDVGRTPVLTTGLPRAARVGVLINLP